MQKTKIVDYNFPTDDNGLNRKQRDQIWQNFATFAKVY